MQRTVILVVTVESDEPEVLDPQVIAEATQRALEGDALCCGSGSVSVNIKES